MPRPRWMKVLRANVVAAKQRLLHGQPAVHPFDAEHGTDTGGVISGASLGSGGENDRHITAYAGVPPSRLLGALGIWRDAVGADRVPEFAFFDLGCGKGRALMVASQWPFAEAVGVELDPGLAKIAGRNVAAWTAAGKAQCPVRAYQGDATSVPYPDGPRVIFIYNAFGPPVIQAVLDSVEARGGETYVIFLNESDETPLRNDLRLETIYRGSMAMSNSDREADPVASGGDITGVYRWKI